ncbi:MAG: Nucleoid occlusion factor SlmA [Chroococcopsis gigantea SAG 12.99]|jgi:AcrR family transcriptional regulator|nr:TetR/AcrR family transcriptional regulator [Chlorogloea purpurea SAG 13.99]MDV2999701.1 Nucleoid occlusion factor SlmA [Chroococcopsis gigantea SAG 12.99]
MPKIVDVEQYKKELLDKCFDLFTEKGYAALTTRELAQELGVSTGTLYHYFANKADLFEQLVEHICQQDVLMAKAKIEGVDTLPAKLGALGEFLSSHDDKCIKQLFLWIEYSQQQDAEELKVSRFFEKVDEKYLQALMEIMNIQDRSLAWIVLNFINGIMLEKMWGNDKISIPEQMRLLGEIINTYIEHQHCRN